MPALAFGESFDFRCGAGCGAWAASAPGWRLRSKNQFEGVVGMKWVCVCVLLGGVRCMVSKGNEKQTIHFQGSP